MDEQSFPKSYNPSEYEPKIAHQWEERGFFKPENGRNTTGKKFSIPMPPPNVTGRLHIGHALTAAIEDILTRFHRLRGDETVWVPGTDHAGIATQAVVERMLLKQGKRRHEMGKEAFLKEVWKWKEEHGSAISNQHRRLGASCDWSRERFTLDEPYQEAVQAAFLHLKRKKRIFRGEYMVNWCPKDRTALSDDEVEYKKTKSKFYYLKYGPVVIATARPETKFLDKTIVVHPKDPRYKKLIGKTFKVPWLSGTVNARVIADTASSMETGTGAMTLTPAHSFVDFELAQKYDLPVVQIIDERGLLTKHAGEFAGQKAHAAREAIVEKLAKLGLVEKVDESYEHNLSVCYRCGTPVEPLVSKQWFVDLPALVKDTDIIRAIEKDEINFIPSRFKKVALHWLTNIRPWCISRQLWWGHSIPGDKSGDVLDTWFSSSLWPFAIVGWSRRSQREVGTPTKASEPKSDYEKYYPMSVLETGYDILFFWVLRMLVMGKELTGQFPFNTVYLHGIVRDKEGRKMSKSLGNVVDPLEVIERFGTDALRLSLVAGTAPGADMRYSETKLVGYRNFANKIWNISRFLHQSITPHDLAHAPHSSHHLPKEFAPYIKEYNELLAKVTRNLEEYQFSQAAEQLYEFIWHTFADKVLEDSKSYLKDNGHSQAVQEAVSIFLLMTWKELLILLHPFMPFVTEAVYDRLRALFNAKPDEFLIVEAWPTKQEVHNHLLR